MDGRSCRPPSPPVAMSELAWKTRPGSRASEARHGCGARPRACLDHVVVFGERHLHHLLRSHTEYYNAVRTHLSLAKDAPISRAVQDVGTIRRCRSSVDCICGRDTARRDG